MPKRKPRTDDFDSIAKKLKLLTEELRQARPKKRVRVISSSSSSSPVSSPSRSPSPSPTRNSTAELSQQEDGQEIEFHVQNDDVINKTEVIVPGITNESTQNNVASELDEETLLILGEDPSIQNKYGKDIQAALAVRLQHIATRGLTKEQRKELQETHLPPANCTLIDGPLLNVEIKAAVPETIAKRDKGIEQKQKQMANAISCIGDAITLIISSEEKNPILLKLLMDASRLMCDCQYTDTIVRRNFILNNLKKEMKDQLQSTKVDKYLFGQDFADTLKSAKAINKSVADLKTNPVNPAAKKPPAKPSISRNYTNPNLNWKAPPQSRRQPGPGSQRIKEPAYPKTPHASSSRTSYSAPSRGRR